MPGRLFPNASRSIIATAVVAVLVVGIVAPAGRVAAAVTVTPNGPWVEGMNSAVVQGGGTGADVATAAGLNSGRAVQAVWYYTGQRWAYHLPAFAVDSVQVPALASVYIALGPSAVTVTPNAGQYVAGANAIVVSGAASAAAVASQIEATGGRPVLSLWVFSGQRWTYFLKSSPGVDGGLSGFAGPVAAAIVILG